MFTGLVEHVGEVTARESRPGGTRLVVSVRELASELSRGDSIAIDGICLTVADLQAAGDPITAAAARKPATIADAPAALANPSAAFAVDAVPTTLARTTLGEMEPGRKVNLERALRAGEALGGHLVQGHVDAVGEVVEASREADALVLRIRLPDDVAEFTVERGSLTVDGVSLTVAELSGGVAKLAIIPYTLGHTNLGRLAAGSRVNLEADLIGKYVTRLLDPYVAAESRRRGGDSRRD